MKIQNILLFIPRALYSSVAKIGRIELTEKIKNEIITNGMYHFVPNENVADEIINSEYLKPSQNIINSYGKPCSYLFCGNPDIDNYSKNLTMLNLSKNPYINPTMVADAIKFSPQNKENLNNYKFRGLSDGAILYEGYCILPHKSVQKVKMVPDLVRDESGKPIKDKNGEYSVIFREAKDNELLSDKNSYCAKQDYLKFMEEKAKQYGYYTNNKIGNSITNIFDQGRMEKDVMLNTVQKNWKDIFNNIFKKRKHDDTYSVDEVLKDFSFSKKNPYFDEKFAKYIAEIQSKDGIVQLDLKDILPEFTQSKTGEFFSNKCESLSDNITKKGLHGKEHAIRVALTAMIIAEKEGILEQDSNNRIKEILSTASMYHDIGRVLDFGPHARRGVKKIEKMDLVYSDGTLFSDDDKKIVLALVDSHEGKPDKINDMIKRYGIKNSEDINLAQRLNSIVRDADALDRARGDRTFLKYKVDLKPKYLVNKTSKQLLNMLYQLEDLTNNVKSIDEILNYKTNRTSDFRKIKLENTLDQYIVDTPKISSNELIHTNEDDSKTEDKIYQEL